MAPIIHSIAQEKEAQGQMPARVVTRKVVILITLTLTTEDEFH